MATLSFLLRSKFPPVLCCSGEISITDVKSIVFACPESLPHAFCNSSLVFCDAQPTQEQAHDSGLVKETRYFAGNLSWHKRYSGDTFSFSLNAILVCGDHFYPKVKQLCLKMKPTERTGIPKRERKKEYLEDLYTWIQLYLKHP